MVPPFKLVDSEGLEYDSSSAYMEGAFPVLKDLNPGVSSAGYVVFDVPPNKSYKLKVDGGYWSSESALVDLSPTTK